MQYTCTLTLPRFRACFVSQVQSQRGFACIGKSTRTTQLFGCHSILIGRLVGWDSSHIRSRNERSGPEASRAHTPNPMVEVCKTIEHVLSVSINPLAAGPRTVDSFSAVHKIGNVYCGIFKMVPGYARSVFRHQCTSQSYIPTISEFAWS